MLSWCWLSTTCRTSAMATVHSGPQPYQTSHFSWLCGSSCSTFSHCAGFLPPPTSLPSLWSLSIKAILTYHHLLFILWLYRFDTLSSCRLSTTFCISAILHSHCPFRPSLSTLIFLVALASILHLAFGHFCIMLCHLGLSDSMFPLLFTLCPIHAIHFPCYGLVSCYSAYMLSRTITYLEHLHNLVVLSLVIYTVLSISIVQALLCVTSKIDSQT